MKIVVKPDYYGRWRIDLLAPGADFRNQVKETAYNIGGSFYTQAAAAAWAKANFPELETELQGTEIAAKEVCDSACDRVCAAAEAYAQLEAQLPAEKRADFEANLTALQNAQKALKAEIDAAIGAAAGEKRGHEHSAAAS